MPPKKSIWFCFLAQLLIQTNFARKPICCCGAPRNVSSCSGKSVHYCWIFVSTEMSAERFSGSCIRAERHGVLLQFLFASQNWQVPPKAPNLPEPFYVFRRADFLTLKRGSIIYTKISLLGRDAMFFGGGNLTTMSVHWLNSVGRKDEW
jgi:hypothetical protein